MNDIEIVFSSHLKDKLRTHGAQNVSSHFENFEVRAKGYYDFFGDKALPFSSDDFFSDFMLARYKGNPFLTLKFSPLSQFKYYNQENPILKLYDSSDQDLIRETFNSFEGVGWSGGFTYISLIPEEKDFYKKTAMDLTAFYLCYCLKNKSPKGIILTANIKSKIDNFLTNCGFKEQHFPHVIHNELVKNPAKLMYLENPSRYMLSCFEKYSQLIPREVGLKKAA